MIFSSTAWRICITDNCRTAEPFLRRAVSVCVEDQLTVEEWFRWGVMASLAAMALWDFDSWTAGSTRMIELARASGVCSGREEMSLKTYGFHDGVRR